MSVNHPDLLLPLAAVPGLDATGLRLYSIPSGGEYVCIGFRPRVAAWYGAPVMSDERTAEECQWVPLGVDVRISLADSATRDRVARWCAERRKLPQASTAPYWGRALMYPRSGRWIIGSPAAYLALAATDHDPSDDTQLPDGSLLADARALKAEAVHLGQEVPCG